MNLSANALANLTLVNLILNYLKSKKYKLQCKLSMSALLPMTKLTPIHLFYTDPYLKIYTKII